MISIAHILSNIRVKGPAKLQKGIRNAYFSSAEALSHRRDIDKGIRRKLRCYIWKQWGRAGYREWRKRGVSVREAWNTSKSAHGPWLLSNTPALALALASEVLFQYSATDFLYTAR